MCVKQLAEALRSLRLYFSKKLHITLILSSIFVFSSQNNFAQGYLGIRATSVYMANPEVINPSPATITTNVTSAFETAIDYTYMGNKKWGFTVGGDFGVVKWSNDFSAPLAAFGTKQGTGEISSTRDHSYLYNSASASGIYKILRGKNSISLFVGSTLRFHQTERTETTYEAYNRIPVWDRSDPKSGAPDVYIESEYDDSPLKTNMFGGLSLQREINEKFSVLLGFRTNIGFKNVEKASMKIIMNDQTFYGSIGSRPEYFGLDLALRYRVYNNKIEKAPREKSSNTYLNGGSRKVVYVEALGNGLLGSVNFDMRLKKDRNDGVGVRVGLGLGELWSDGRYTSIPLSINYILGKRKNGLEAGIGMTPQITLRDLDEGSNIKAIGFMNLGYRLQPLNKGIVVRAMITPAFNSNGFHGGWGGLSLGYGFR